MAISSTNDVSECLKKSPINVPYELTIFSTQGNLIVVIIEKEKFAIRSSEYEKERPFTEELSIKAKNLSSFIVKVNHCNPTNFVTYGDEERSIKLPLFFPF